MESYRQVLNIQCSVQFAVHTSKLILQCSVQFAVHTTNLILQRWHAGKDLIIMNRQILKINLVGISDIFSRAGKLEENHNCKTLCNNRGTRFYSN